MWNVCRLKPVKPVFWSTNTVRYLYSLLALFVLYWVKLNNNRQYLLLRTDILQKTVTGCPWSMTIAIPVITLSTARCLYQVQWLPSTLYDSLYVVTLSSLLYRPCVATLVTAVISPRLICNHWLTLLLFGHQTAICLPSVKRLSLAREGPCCLSKLLEAENALSGMRMSSTPSGIEQLWTRKQRY